MVHGGGEERLDAVFRGGVVVGAFGVGSTDVGVREGRIAAIGDLSRRAAAQSIDCRGLHVLPGVIDSHVHFREPGGETREDIESGTRAAALGGVVAVFEMPNTNPPTIDAPTLRDKLARAAGRAHVDHAFYVGAGPSNVGRLAELEAEPGCAGVKLFMGSSTGDLLVHRTDDVRAVLADGRRRVSVHSEDEERLIAREGLRAAGDPSSHPVWRDAECARMNTERLIGLARETGRRIHVLHVSTAVEIALLAAAKDVCTAEATPHHLTFDGDEAYRRLGTKLQMNPPIRGAQDRDAVFDAVRAGVIDTVGSDHAPHLLAEKARPYPESPSGMPGVQTLVPVLLDHVARGRLTLQRFVDLTSAGPKRVYGMAGKGRLAVGYDADLTVVDLGAERMVEDGWIASKCGWTPYVGATLRGWPVGTVVRGQRVMWEGEIVAAGGGRPVRFEESLDRD